MGGLAIMAVINLGILFGFSHHHAWSGAFTARIPDQCQTFEEANAPANKAYCDAWFAAHKRGG